MFFKFMLSTILLSLLIIFVDLLIPELSRLYLVHKYKKIKKHSQEKFKKKMKELEIK